MSSGVIAQRCWRNPIRLSALLSSALIVVAFAGHVLAQSREPTRKERDAATQDFQQCIEIEQVGDATACWKLWLTKHETTGSLAEVTLAREHAARAPAASGAPASATQVPTTQAAPANTNSADQVTSAEFDKQVAEAMGETVEPTVEQTQAEPLPASTSQAPEVVRPPPVTTPMPESGAVNPKEATANSARTTAASPLERPSQVGLSIQPQLAMAAAFNNYGRSYMTRSDGSTEYGLRVPSFVVGGGLAVGYDIGRSTGWSDTHVRISGSYLHGTNGIEMSANLIPIDISIEKGYRVRPNLLWYGAAGWTGTIIEVKVRTSPGGLGPSGDLSSFAWGGALCSGFEVQMTPALGFRAELFTRLNLFGGKYNAADKDAKLADFDRRQDYFSEFGLTLGLTWRL